MADNLSQKYSNDDSNESLPLALKDIGGVLYAGSILCQTDGTYFNAASAALQTAGNDLLTTIDADTGSISTAVGSINTKTPSLGQALAAASVPVVLTAAQLTTLTPPAAITGFATAANQLPDGHNVTVDNASIAVTGTFWQATQPVSLTSTTVTGTVAVTQSGTWDEVGINDSGNSITIDAPVGTPAFVRLSDGSAAITTLPVSLASVPSHAVTNAGTFAVQVSSIAAGTNYIGKFRPTDGTTDAEVVPLTGYNAQAVAIVDGDGAQITSFGGGVQYTEGDTDASITGTACMWEDTSNTLVATSAAKPLPVEIVAGAGSGGTAAADDADFTAGTTSGTPVMGVYESTPTSVTDGDLGTAGITATRQLRVSSAQEGTYNITNVSGTVSLPTGASTAAKQPALGTAGTASSDVITVQGITGMTPLIVDLGANNDVTVTGTVTANAGTNLNTSALALETGGNLAAAATSLALIDNAVNGSGFNISQISAVTFGAGASDTGTQRIVLASNDPAVALLGTIDTDTGGIATSTASIDGKITACNTGAVVISSGTVAATQSGTWNIGTVTPGTAATNLGKAIDSAAGSTDTGVAILAIRDDALSSLTPAEGDYAPLRVGSTGALHVTGAVTQSGSWFVAGSVLVEGGQAHGDAYSSGNPLINGGVATATLSGATLVSAGDATLNYSGIDGVPIVRNHTNLEDIVTATPVAITDGSSTSVLAAQGSGIKTYVTSITIANSSATFVTVDLRDGTAGSVKWTFPVPATGGVTHTFDPPLPFSANTAVAADPSASASTITVSLNGFKSKV